MRSAQSRAASLTPTLGRPGRVSLPSRLSGASAWSGRSEAGADPFFMTGVDLADDRLMLSESLVQSDTAFGRLCGWARGILCHSMTENIIATLVLVNIVVIVIETDLTAQNSEMPLWLSVINSLIFYVFLIEVSMRILVFRCMFFRNVLNLVDLVAVGADVLTEITTTTEAMPRLSAFRILRLFRLGRSIRVIMFLPQLAVMVKGVLAALSTTLWGFVLIFITVMLWSVVAVQVVHPLNMELAALGQHADCGRCPHAFESVAASALTLYETFIMGDGFSMTIIPLVDANPWVLSLFICVYITVNVAVLNVILSVIVESAMRVSQEDARLVAQKREQYTKQRMDHLVDICKEIDGDNSGTLQLEEVLQALDSHEEFSAELRAMDIQEKDMSIIFKILDADGSGDIDYIEFAEELHKMKSHDAHTMLVFIQHYCMSIQDELRILDADLRESLRTAIEQLCCKLHMHKSDTNEAKGTCAHPKEPKRCDAIANGSDDEGRVCSLLLQAQPPDSPIEVMPRESTWPIAALSKRTTSRAWAPSLGNIPSAEFVFFDYEEDGKWIDL